MSLRSPERNTLNFFLSYAHEDDDLLSSIYKCLQYSNRGISNRHPH
jgi:hypothetical protein